jgi:hypothetical protein
LTPTTSSTARLGDGNRHFTRLAIAEADLALAVTDHGQCGEAHLATALDGLGHTVDGNQLFQQAVGIFAIGRRHVLFHVPGEPGLCLRLSRLEL